MFIYLQPRILVIALLGLASGMPLCLSASSLATMLSEQDVSIKDIAMFGLASIPYAFKYLWAPYIDKLSIPFFTAKFGRRRSWLLCIQVFLILSIIFVGLYGLYPDKMTLSTLAIGVICLAFFSASQDIVIDAYRIEILSNEEQAAGAAAAAFSYRIGMLISGAGGLVLAHYMNWFMAYLISGLVLVPGGIAAFLYGEPNVKYKIEKIKNVSNIFQVLWLSLSELFRDLVQQKNWLAMVIFIATYKLSDAYIGMVTTPFLVEMGFSKAEIASVSKLYGFIATSAGMLFCGYLLKRNKDLKLMLVIGLILQALSNIVFGMQAFYPGDVEVLIGVISVENFCGGLSSAVLVSYISSIVKKDLTATHYALLSSLAAFGRSVISSSSGYSVSLLGWVNFFIFSAFLSLPALICIYYLRCNKNNKR